MLAISMASTTRHLPPSQKRPKLSLQTGSLAVNFSCTSQSLADMAVHTAAATPTAINTFNNTYDLAHRPTSFSSTMRMKSSSMSRSNSPRPLRRIDRTYSNSSLYGIKSILKNSEASSLAATASPLTGTRKVFFPQPKKVSFKKELEEDIVTKVYVAKHSDLVWEEEEHEEEIMQSIETEDKDIALSASSSSAKEPWRPSTVCLSSTEVTKRKQHSPTFSTRQTSRKRRWEWTLSPVSSDAQDASVSASDLDSEWVVVTLEKGEGDVSQCESTRPSKRRAESLGNDNRLSKRPVCRPLRANTL